jgi:hypothetical protein
MTSRSRYDTIALVQKLQRERRRGLILGFTGGGILIALIVVYFVTMRGNNIAQVPGDVAPRPVTDSPPVVTGFMAPTPPAQNVMDAGSAMASPFTAPVAAGQNTAAAGTSLTTVAPPPPPRHVAPSPPPPSTPGFLRATFPKNAIVYLDDAQLGRSSGQSMLEPGQHVVKAKLGKKTVSQKIEVKPGDNIAVKVDKKGKIAVDRK